MISHQVSNIVKARSSLRKEGLRTVEATTSKSFLDRRPSFVSNSRGGEVPCDDGRVRVVGGRGRMGRRAAVGLLEIMLE